MKSEGSAGESQKASFTIPALFTLFHIMLYTSTQTCRPRKQDTETKFICLNKPFFQRLLKEMEGLLGCWSSFLLPLSLDPELSKQAQHLCKSLSAKGVTVSEEMLKVSVVVF